MYNKTTNEVILYGIDNISEKLDGIIHSLNLEKQCFEIKLIMSEAIANAFIHGNNKDRDKPIIVECKLENNFINISVKDTGKENLTLKTNKEIDEDDILSEGGRGLFIISAYTDEAEFKDGCLIMKKSLK